MGKAYSQDQRERVKGLLELGRDEESIEKETGVSDRTIRRWKLELERTGRIGKVRDICPFIPKNISTDALHSHQSPGQEDTGC